MNAAIAVFSTALLTITAGCQRQAVESTERVGAASPSSMSCSPPNFQSMGRSSGAMA